MEWAYGVTTVLQRRYDLLPDTLRSLALVGFNEPRLFVDGCDNEQEYRRAWQYLPMTFRSPKVGAFGNWIMALHELHIRQPRADRYAIFQDDLLACRNLRQYLESVTYPDRGYWNLFTCNANHTLSTGAGFHLSNQNGRGAVALVFDCYAVEAILSDGEVLSKPRHVNRPTDCVDGAVVAALKKAGVKEWVHDPSLVQHTGKTTAIGHGHSADHTAESFRGGDWNPISLLSNSSR